MTKQVHGTPATLRLNRLLTAGRGGRRPGAGRPATIPEGTHVWSVRVTEEEQAALVKLLRKLRTDDTTAEG